MVTGRPLCKPTPVNVAADFKVFCTPENLCRCADSPAADLSTFK
jgi:hypothetical protein